MTQSTRHLESSVAITLGETWPSFLDLLDRDPDRAFAEFFSFAKRVLRVCAPRALAQVPVDSREDLIHEIILHCYQSGFRVLKRYSDQGRPFSSWFLLVARNKVLDHVRSTRKVVPMSITAEDDEGRGMELVDPAPPVGETTDHRRIISLVREALQAMSEQCQILVQGAAEGYKPRQLTQLLGWPRTWNKKASDALRECRHQLRRQLAQRGLDDEELSLHFGG